MKHEFIIKNGSSSVAILFAGWGMSPTPFKDAKISQDLLFVWDYNDYSFDTSVLESYSNIYLFAWSFGVYGASRFATEHPNLPICFKMAINGTLSPIDNFKGIPEKIFRATADTLNEHSLLKFYRRMCASASQYEQFIASKPERDIESLRNELMSVYNTSKKDIYDTFKWDKVVIGLNDLIFPASNQIEAWRGYSDNVIHINDSHMPNNLINIISDNIINKALLKRRFTRKLSEYNKLAVCQQHISQHLYDLWLNSDYRKDRKVLEIGCGTGFLTNLYLPTLNPSTLVLNDLCNIPAQYFKAGNSSYTFIQGDAELIDFDTNTKFDYIVSASALQWFENIVNFFDKAYSLLNNDGVIVFSTFGKKNMKEINSITGLSLNYLEIDQLRDILSVNFEILYLNEEESVLHFDTPIDVIRHIKSTGVNSISDEPKWNKTQLKKFTANYNKTDEKYPLTYNPIYIIARKKYIK